MGRREQPLPPRKQTATNHSPKSQNIPPVQKIPAKIEFPPTLVFAGFLCLEVTQALLPVLPAGVKDQAGMPESRQTGRIAGLSGSGIDFES